MNAPGKFGFYAPRAIATGHGYFAGEAPEDPGDAESPDGRAKLNGTPARIRILLFERAVMVQPIESLLSASDGTWRIDNLDLGRDYLIIGLDETGALNADVQDWVRPDPVA